MRILQLNKLYSPWIGGIESVVKTVAEALGDDCGMQVLVCQPKGSGKTEVVNGVNVVRAGSLGIHFSMPISLSFPFLVRKYAKESDIIILHDPFPLGDLAVLLSGFKGKVIVWWHSDIIKQKKLLKFVDPIIYRLLDRADAIFTTSDRYIDGSSYISDYREKCRLVPYGIDVPKYLSVDGGGFLTEKLTDPKNVKILFVGRLVYYKGVAVLLRAFAHVENAELFIVGTGADEQSLREIAAESNHVVHFMGNLSDDDLKKAFADCDFFVLPSIEKSEAFAIVQLEAMVYGKPVINTDLDTSVPFVSIHNETGLTVPKGNYAELADAMNMLVSDSALREKLGQNAKKRVLEHFSLDKMIENVKNQCESILGE